MSSNLFTVKPEISEPVQPETWVDPVSGLIVPMDPDQNIQYRSNILNAADGDPDLRTEIYTACSESLIYWITSFVFTLRVFESDAEGHQKQASDVHVPFCLWPQQVKLALELYDCITNGREILVDKSRDMGCSWVCIAVLTWFFLFRNDQSLLILSRKEDAVDQLDGMAKSYPFGSIADPGTLLGKVDYILSRLPEWMVPSGLSRKKMHLVNPANKSRIDGESANATAGSSDRRTAIFLDEFAKVDEAESIKRSTKDVTACRIVVSTPNGAGTTFSKWRLSGQIKVFPLMWFHHIEKGRGLTAVEDRLGRWKLTSPWYEREAAMRTPKELAIEVDADHVGSGEVFFEPHILEQHKRLFCRPPRGKATIQFKKKLNEDQIVAAIRKRDLALVERTPGGPWNVWVDLVNGRLDQSKTYVLSIDISKGQGASNSVINVSCVETRDKVMEFADANTPPYELARIVCAAAIWVGGRSHRPLVIYENNGDAGLDFGRQFCLTYKYPNVYFDKQHGTIRQKVGKRYGWRSSTDKKAEALGLLRRAYAHGQYINRSTAAVDEATTYVQFEGGGIGPSELVNESDAARKAHGDRVIADMLAVWLLADQRKIGKVGESKTSPRCFGARFTAWKREKKRNQDTARTFNFAEAP